MTETCSIEGCGTPAVARGWCSRHYQRWLSHGDPLTNLNDRTSEDRFWAKVLRGAPRALPRLGPCWSWFGARTTKGYGTFQQGRRPVYAHRYCYELLVGPIPDGLVLDHLCRVTFCVNPDHLEPVTVHENWRRGIGPLIAGKNQRTKTHCPQGHPYDEDNTYWWRGFRNCRTCRRERQRVART